MKNIGAGINNYQTNIVKNIFDSLQNLFTHLAKVTFNSNGWINPSGSENKLFSNDFVAFYEDQYGFRLKEWNFSRLRILDDNHFGFIQAINNNDNLRKKFYLMYYYLPK